MIKYIVFMCAGFVLGGCLTAYAFIMKCGNLIAVAKKNEEKYKNYYNLLLAWMTKREEGKNPSKYLGKNNYKKIAIYGKGRIAEHLNADLMSIGYQVAYYIDVKSEKIEKGVKLYRLDEELPTVDLVIVTVLKEYDSICEKLMRSYCCKNVDIISADKFIIDYYQ